MRGKSTLPYYQELLWNSVSNQPLPSGIQESDLVAGLRAGAPEAFPALVRQLGGRLLGMARRLMGNEEDARDVVQEAFLSAFRSLDGFREGSSLSTWLHRITVNAALMKLRTRRRKPERSIENLLPQYLEDGHRIASQLAWEVPGDSLLQRQETRTAVRRCMAELPDDFRVILELRDVEGMDTQATAQLLGIGESLAKTRLHRARQALRTLLEREFAA